MQDFYVNHSKDYADDDRRLFEPQAWCAWLFMKIFPNGMSLLASLYHCAYVCPLAWKGEDDNTFVPVALNGNIFSSSLRVSHTRHSCQVLRPTVKAPVKFGMPWPSLFSFFSPFIQNTKDRRKSRVSEKLRRETEAISISVHRQKPANPHTPF